MMYTNGHVSEGEKVLVLGASGGVGVCCIMLAKMAGAEVVACTSSDAKMERLKAFGADHVINYQRAGLRRSELRALRQAGAARRRRQQGRRCGRQLHRRRHLGEVDALPQGGRSAADLRRHRRFDPKEDIRFIWTFELKVLGSNGWAREDIHKLLELVRSGKLKVPIDRSYRLEEAVDAMRVMEDRELFGKIVVTP